MPPTSPEPLQTAVVTIFTPSICSRSDGGKSRPPCTADQRAVTRTDDDAEDAINLHGSLFRLRIARYRLGYDFQTSSPATQLT